MHDMKEWCVHICHAVADTDFVLYDNQGRPIPKVRTVIEPFRIYAVEHPTKAVAIYYSVINLAINLPGFQAMDRAVRHRNWRS